jgi:acyl carrier protein
LTASCDVSQADELAAAMKGIPAHLPLRGVFHAAGVLDDASLLQQTRDRFHTVLAAKVAGAWNLHSLTLHHDLDCFVLYSSAAGVFGSPGQANHAAANTALDALAHYRRDQLGLTALSIDWGTWSGTGAAVRHSVVERSERAGAVSIAPDEGIRILQLLLQTNAAQVLVSSVNWKLWADRNTASASANADLLQHVLDLPNSDRACSDERSHGVSLVAGKPGQISEQLPQKSWRQQLLSAPPDGLRSLLEARLDSRIREVLALGPKQPIDPARPLQEYGLDSLLSIELRNALSADLDTRLPATMLFDYPTLASLTNWLFRDVLKLGTPADQHKIEVHPDSEVLREVSTLSDEEVERLFQQKMAGIHP